jgi:DNA-binding transcriptional LysR family regulator
MLKLESVASFVSIVESGSIAAAARRSGISKSVVSERLTELERVLGTKLIRRTTRKLSPTQDGHAFYGRAKQILRDVDNAAAAVASRRGTLVGPLRISAPVSFGSLHLGPALFGLLAGFPSLELTLDLEDRFVDVMAEGYDAVVRHGPVDDRRLIVKRLAVSRRLLVASPDYLKRHGQPRALPELVRHRGIIYSNRGASDWRFRAAGKWVTVRPDVALRVNNGLLMREAAVSGVGIALLATFLLKDALRDRALRVVDVGAEPEGATIYVAYPQDLRDSAKIRALAACLTQAFGDPPYWDHQQPRSGSRIAEHLSPRART